MATPTSGSGSIDVYSKIYAEGYDAGLKEAQLDSDIKATQADSTLVNPLPAGAAETKGVDHMTALGNTYRDAYAAGYGSGHRDGRKIAEDRIAELPES